ncbi:MAG: hypothetical protein A2Y82_03795 [Candidatus Buchananbacteria bacterium RBG_13_36_9]|uniref:Uncharacterized protein n=1 Tax=Candidatus Buchananbacteria bacterium RBG_13_36_9 TaxID=1797530 RepID=A0A1G1XNW2_9BACT|nr:MAG: hypothetical protein A2Y82_03795 [Candidatus Buchananbacteria bacterium RBG_13_36_9]
MGEQKVCELSNEALVQYFENAVTKKVMPVPEQVPEALRDLGPKQAQSFKEEIIRRLNEGKKRGY